MIHCKTTREKPFNTKIAGNVYSLIMNSHDFLAKKLAMIGHVIL